LNVANKSTWKTEIRESLFDHIVIDKKKKFEGSEGVKIWQQIKGSKPTKEWLFKA
jgi:hypothetical protein